MHPLFLAFIFTLILCGTPFLTAIVIFRDDKEMRRPQVYPFIMLVVGALSELSLYILFNHGL